MGKAVFAVLAIVFSVGLSVQELLATHEATRERYSATDVSVQLAFPFRFESPQALLGMFWRGS